MSALFKRGEIYWCALDPVVGAEQAKVRPCVVVSSTLVNKVRRTIVIVPLTTTSSPLSWPVLIATPSVRPESKARVEQVRAIDKSRALKLIGSLGRSDLKSITDALATVLEVK
ncbi:MAG: type II toxin-antitoxin system PemK/MazF family toxin [Cytophagales bacterium]|nr:type II toxin-antitoxin system PemK/MazF family toxin [Cytophagales bacterium]